MRAVTVADTQLTHDLIEELRRGTTKEFLELIASSHPEAKRDRAGARVLVAELLTVCDPVQPEQARRAHLLIRCPQTAVAFGRSVAAEFARRGHHVTLTGSEHPLEQPCDLVIDVAERVLSPRRYLPLMSEDTPHLVVARDDDGLLLGPLVVPGVTPCLRCDDLRHLADDETWIATATQLHDLEAPHPPVELEWVAAVTIANSVQAFLAGVPPQPGEAFAFRRERITATRRGATAVAFQPGCGCQAPTETARVSRQASAKGATAPSLA